MNLPVRENQPPASLVRRGGPGPAGSEGETAREGVVGHPLSGCPVQGSRVPPLPLSIQIPAEAKLSPGEPLQKVGRRLLESSASLRERSVPGRLGGFLEP